MAIPNPDPDGTLFAKILERALAVIGIPLEIMLLGLAAILAIAAAALVWIFLRTGRRD